MKAQLYRNTDTSLRTTVMKYCEKYPFSFLSDLLYCDSGAQVMYRKRNLTRLCLCRQAMLIWVSVGSASLRSVALTRGREK